MRSTISDRVFQAISEYGPLTAKEIQEHLKRSGVVVAREAINSELYGALRSAVVRDVNVKGVPSFRIRQKRFTPAGGLETKFYHELIRQKVILEDSSHLGYTIKNPKSGKTYHLDIAVFVTGEKYDIEIDGFDHVRADALASLERQIIESGKHAEIEIDWMDNEKSFIRYDEIDTKLVYSWLGKNIDWCIRYHEELLWPKDITRNIWLIEKGWHVIRFWNTQVQKDMKRCIREVKEWIGK